MKLSVRVGVVFVIVSAVAVLGIVLSMGPKGQGAIGYTGSLREVRDARRCDGRHT
ncbi:MAG: hypothetical protein IPJ30_12710 [Acidobacteria bacterium]|nr:hypothetical protein [Acidobacteriota bacterium]